MRCSLLVLKSFQQLEGFIQSIALIPCFISSSELKARPEIIVPTKKGARTIALPRYFREKQKKDLTIEEQAEKITRLRERQLERVELAESYSSKGYMEKLQDEERRQKKRQAELNRKEQL